MHQDAKDILYTEEQLKARVAELGRQISADYRLIVLQYSHTAVC